MLRKYEIPLHTRSEMAKIMWQRRQIDPSVTKVLLLRLYVEEGKTEKQIAVLLRGKIKGWTVSKCLRFFRIPLRPAGKWDRKLPKEIRVRNKTIKTELPPGRPKGQQLKRYFSPKYQDSDFCSIAGETSGGVLLGYDSRRRVDIENPAGAHLLNHAQGIGDRR